MVYHFKKRMDVLEQNNETLGDICKTIIKELETFKQINDPKTQTGYVSREEFPGNLFKGINVASQTTSEDLLKHILLSDHVLGIPTSSEIHIYDTESDSSGNEPFVEELDEVSIMINEQTDIMVKKLEESDTLVERVEDKVEEPKTNDDQEKIDKQKLSKLNVNSLKSIVIKEGYCTDPSKMKKNELIKMILEEETKRNN